MPSPLNSPVDLCNLANTYIGERAIRSIEPPSSEIEKMYARLYEHSRQYCLGLGAWTFAIKQANINKTDDPLFGFESAYLLPADFISLVSLLGDPTILFEATKYRIMERNLLYNSSSNSISIEYVFDQTNISWWSPQFKEVVALHLATTVAYNTNKKKNVIEIIEAKYKAALYDAIIKDGQDEPPQRIERSRALQARLTGSPMWNDDPSKVVFDEP